MAARGARRRLTANPIAILRTLPAPAAGLLLRLDRVADRPERLRGASGAPSLAAALASEPGA